MIPVRMKQEKGEVKQPRRIIRNISDCRCGLGAIFRLTYTPVFAVW